MPTLVTETHDPEKPILFIIGESNPLIPYLIEQYKKDFKIALVSATSSKSQHPRANTQEPTSDIYRINPANSSLIKNLKEKIEYAIVFCEDAKIKEFIGPIFEKFAQDLTKTVVICAIEKIDEFTDVANAVKSASNFYFLFEGDVYSEIEDFNKSETANLIDDAVHKKEVALTSDDLKPIFSIYYKDAISSITQILLGPAQLKKYFYLFYDHPQTYISAVHIFQRVEPELKIVYKNDVPAQRLADLTILEKEIESRLSEKPVFINQNTDGFEKSIKHFIKRGPIIKPVEKPSIINAPKRLVKSNNKTFKILTSAILVALILFVVVEVTAAFGTFYFFKNSIQNFKKGEYKKASTEAKTAKSFLDLVDPAASIITSSAAKANMSDLPHNYQLFSTAVTMANTASLDSDNLTKIGGGITNEALNTSIADAVWLYFLGQKLSLEVKDQNIGAYLTPEMSRVLTLAQVAPQVLGFSGERRYLLLFQNNGELRPTGGFIGSVGELTVKNGRIEDLNLQDVYEYDGQLKVHIEPYHIVRRFLQPNLYLRDSNFDPDFQSSASMSALLFKLEGGKKVDGVIAINFEAVKQIIGAIGPIQLTTYKKTLYEKNTFDFLQSTIDNNFFPGSTAKKDVLQALFDKIMLSMENPTNAVKVARLIPQLAAEKNILFAFNQNSIQSVFSSVGFGGEYKDLRKTEVGSINDYLGINEANIGVNKANIGIVRSTNLNVTLAGNKVASKITHKINNGSKKGYNLYIRFIVPGGSKLTGVKIDGETQKIVPAITDPKVYERKGFVAPADLEVAQESLNGKAVFGFRTIIAPKSDSTIEVEYDNGISVDNSSRVSYSLQLIKQPGTGPFPFSLNLIYGTGFTPKEVKNAKLENGVIIIDEKVNSDMEFKIQLLRR